MPNKSMMVDGRHFEQEAQLSLAFAESTGVFAPKLSPVELSGYEEYEGVRGLRGSETLIGSQIQYRCRQ